MDTEVAVAVVLAIGFAVTNGLHDAANSIATLVATRAASPGPAIVLASIFNIPPPLPASFKTTRPESVARW